MLEAKTQEGAETGAAGHTPRRKSAPQAKQPVCIVLHQEHSNPGHVGQWFVRNGYKLDIRKPRYGDPLPQTLENHCGAVIFGGPMSANDKDAFICAETEWIGVALKEDKPFFGICLGAQMLANHLGAKVGFHPEEIAEIGYYPLVTTADGVPFGTFPGHVYQWHREGFDLPLGGELLAEGDSFPVQAFRYGGPAYALQFHPDVTHAMMCRWTTRGHERMLLPNAKPRIAHFADRAVYDPAGRAWLAAFLNHWLGQTENGHQQSAIG